LSDGPGLQGVIVVVTGKIEYKSKKNEGKTTQKNI
jgi:hypothetical protein